MGKTWAAVALVLLAAGPAALLADDPAIRRVTRRHDTFGGDYLPPSTQEVSPAVPGGTASSPAANSPAVAASTALPAGALVNGSCCGCCAHATPPHQHFACIHRLIDWLSYHPLKKGVNCDRCGHDGHGDCCCYHCFPPVYLYMIQPCVDGHPPSIPCWGCSCCGQDALTPVIPPSTATKGAAFAASGTTPMAPAAVPAGNQSPPPPDGEKRGFFGQRHRLFSLSTGFGCCSVGGR